MKTSYLKHLGKIALLIPVLAVFACQEDLVNQDVYGTSVLPELTASDQEALYFMLEEEKLAKDVYGYLAAYWNHNTFENIERSESSHVNAVATLMDAYNLEYDLGAAGVFENQELQELYHSLIAVGEADLGSALTVGATIEDLDIKDLENYLNEVTNPWIQNVFTSLQCGSRNHLRAFTGSLDLLEISYVPQYISVIEYESILTNDWERCN
jgi:hypothetical protein